MMTGTHIRADIENSVRYNLPLALRRNYSLNLARHRLSVGFSEVSGSLVSSFMCCRCPYRASQRVFSGVSRVFVFDSNFLPQAARYG